MCIITDHPHHLTKGEIHRKGHGKSTIMRRRRRRTRCLQYETTSSCWQTLHAWYRRAKKLLNPRRVRWRKTKTMMMMERTPSVARLRVPRFKMKGRTGAAQMEPLGITEVGVLGIYNFIGGCNIF